MLDRSLTPSITVTIGRHTRLYFAFITTASAELDSPATNSWPARLSWLTSMFLGGLVFFLGGIPLQNPLTLPAGVTPTFGMTGFGKDPVNPFTNSVVGPVSPVNDKGGLAPSRKRRLRHHIAARPFWPVGGELPIVPQTRLNGTRQYGDLVRTNIRSTLMFQPRTRARVAPNRPTPREVPTCL